MNVQQKIAKKRIELDIKNQDKPKVIREETKKTVCQRHGYMLTTSLILLGMTIGALWTNVYKETIAYINVPNTPIVIMVNAAHANEKEDISEIKEYQLVGNYIDTIPKGRSVVEIADYIWFKESTRGKNNYSKCQEQNLVNDMGYAIPGDGTYVCFNNHAEAMATVIDWIKKHQKEGMSELELLCHYSGNNYKECKN